MIWENTTMQILLAIWILAYVIVVFGTIFNIKKNKKKYNLTKITTIAGISLAISLFIIIMLAMTNSI
ncbi:hypothetical protein [Sinanaerobacter chloroacetimidivorans]|uniref:Uncharacterized protein n=1 Tax=Sinanaerobacter chloroacetimidivorans TaxID=2818044 RepID=A0A8J7W266_9FIRM|nr:hypothetical protein [Sinanaerobacter chloroacetimidivorans]MBR0597885.1 hypothetical protein [Sinanaerobacter chloroacetimidivorans]